MNKIRTTTKIKHTNKIAKPTWKLATYTIHNTYTIRTNSLKKHELGGDVTDHIKKNGDQSK